MEQWVFITLAVLNIAILGWLIFLTAKYKDLTKKAGIIFSDKEPTSLGEKLKGYINDVKAVEDHCFRIDKELKKIALVANEGLFKKGFVRYNPFGDVGGNQSFSLCLLNKEENGYVISSIHSREGTRVYAKTVEGGKSEYNLSEEEQKAIKLAKGGRGEENV